MTSKTKQFINKAVDAFEKCSTPATRAGNTVERVGKMAAGGVSRNAIAVQMTERSRNDVEWTEQKVGVICDLYLESKTQVLITSSQASALMEDIELELQSDLDEDAVATPA